MLHRPDLQARGVNLLANGGFLNIGRIAGVFLILRRIFLNYNVIGIIWTVLLYQTASEPKGAVFIARRPRSRGE